MTRVATRPAPTVGTAAPATRPQSALGQWNSAVTSYYVLAGSTALLLVLGLVMVLSSSSIDALAAGESPYTEFLDQAKFALVGLPVLFVLSRIPPTRLRALAWPLLAGAVVFQGLVFTPLGVARGGNRNWVALPGFSAQPSEVIKLALAVWLGAVLARKLPLLRQWKRFNSTAFTWSCTILAVRWVSSSRPLIVSGSRRSPSSTR